MVNKDNTHIKGLKSEALAADYLTGKGFSIIETNFRYGRNGEIDIIALQNEVLVFVEVKSANTTIFGSPVEYITDSKIKKLKLTAQAYLMEKSKNDIECRFDVIAIDYTTTPIKITHLENAF